MKIPNLALNSTFSIPDFVASTPPPPPTMCNYTIHNFSCGHKAEDHVDSSRCPEFQRTGVHCGRDNPANRRRVTVRSEDRSGACNTCSGGVASGQMDPMESDIQRARELSLADAKTYEEEMRLFEQRAKEESMAEAEKSRKAHEARIEELEKESIEAYNRDMQKREMEDLEFIIRRSREDAQKAAHKAEMEMMERAFKESLKMDSREYQDQVVTKGSTDFSNNVTADWTRVDKTTLTPAPAHIPPPPLPSALNPTPQITPRPPIDQRSGPPNVVDYTLPPIGPQNIGRFKIGTRHQPEHESQRLEQSNSPTSPILPISPAPFARLGGPLVGRDRSAPLPADPRVDPKLAALLAKRRTWEEEKSEDEAVLGASLASTSSASDVSMRTDPPGGGAGGLSTMPPVPPVPRIPPVLKSMARPAESENTGAAADSWDEEDTKTLRAKRLSRFDFDQKRQSGWGGE